MVVDILIELVHFIYMIITDAVSYTRTETDTRTP